jgi:hypothetical protein
VGGALPSLGGDLDNVKSYRRSNPARPGERPSTKAGAVGRAQLTIVEHSLCPLDTSASLVEGLIHRAEFLYVDENRHQRRAESKVICPLGLSAVDEFYLWGLVALTLARPDWSTEFYATPHYCLTELGIIARDGQNSRAKGGKDYQLFRQSITRLSAVTYRNERFYDPVRGEHRDVSFGFLSYSLPADPRSTRAWRFAWDPIFLEFCQAARGSLLFDLGTYRSLDAASRRLFLLLQKIFWRNAHSPAFDVRHLGVNLLGIAPSVDIRDMKVKIARCAQRLAEFGIIEGSDALGAATLFEKKGIGSYTIRFQRGAYFRREHQTPDTTERSPMHGLLEAIGFDDPMITRILRKYPLAVVQVWADITLAAMEKSPTFFKVGPPAYFLDNVEKAQLGQRTPPDWWHQHCKEEERRARAEDRSTLNLPEVPPVVELSSLEPEPKGCSTPREVLSRLSKTAHDEEAPASPESKPHGPVRLGEILERFRRLTSNS